MKAKISREIGFFVKVILSGVLFLLYTVSFSQVEKNDSTALNTSKEPDSVFFMRLEQKSSNNKILKEFFDLTIKNQEPVNQTELTDNAEKWYDFKGFIIKNIVIKQPPPGRSLLPYLKSSDSSKLNQFILKLHVYTKPAVLQKNLYLKPGDSLIPWKLADNEKLIRDLPFIEDARFYPESIDNDSLTLILVAQDKIPYGAFPIFHSTSKQSLKIWNSNFFGYGNEFGFSVTNETPEFYLSDIYFTINNLNKKFIQNRLRYQRSLEQEYYTVTLERPYLPGAYNLAGGLELGRKQETLPSYFSDSPDITSESRYLEGNLWIGYLIERNSGTTNNRPVYIIPAVALYNTYFQKRPFVSVDSNYVLNNNTRIIASINLMEQNFAESDKLFAQDHTQTLPVGKRIGISLGYNWSEYRNMPYFGANIRWGMLGKNNDYWLFTSNFGSYVFRNELTQGAFNFSTYYLTKLFSKDKKYSYRILAGISYSEGINRLSYDSLYLKNDYGITGLRTDVFKGMKRINSELQFILYTPWKWIGFSFTPYLLLQSGFIAEPNEDLLQKRLVSAFGIGLRLRNRFLVFSSIQFHFMYYPYAPQGANSWSLDVSDNIDWKTFSFDPGRPDEVLFR